MEMEENCDSEQVSDLIYSAVCLDLLYKPIVLVCGHVTCFWCCHHSMDFRGRSHCPLCRHPYNHFPAICQMLDVFLKKMYPISYEKKKSQTLVDEEQMLDVNEESNDLSNVDQPSHIISEDNLSINPSNNEENKSNNENCNQIITVADMSCGACNQLLFRPVVLNCGHVFCETCITVPEDGVIKCKVCEFRHPSGFPKVCKELDCVLEEKFSSEYAVRKNTAQISQEKIQNPVNLGNNEGFNLPYPTEENFLQWWTVHGSKIHPGVGCDLCGMYPIIGERYQCKDCTEKSGYDLCGDCHNTNSNLLLVNQQLVVISAASRNQLNPVHGIASSSINDNDDDHDDGDDNDNDDGNAI